MQPADDLNEARVRRRAIPRLGRPARIVLAAALVLLAALVVLWLVRKPIATHFIDGQLARAGVPARYEIADLGFGRQRLTNVVLGDPARPDLVADWIETDTTVGLAGPSLAGVRAGHVRLRARLIGGKLSLGAIDRLLPPSGNKPFALPKLALDIADGRMRLETPWGVAGIALSGTGRLDDGFAGQAAIRAATLSLGSCRISDVRVTTAIRIRRGAPSLAGMAGAALMPCGPPNTILAQGPGTRFDVTLSPTLDSWRGNLTGAGAAVANVAIEQGIDRAYADVRFAGDRARTAGSFRGASGSAVWRQAGRGVTMRGAAYDGTFVVGASGSEMAMTATARQVALDPAMRHDIAAQRTASSGTPVAPLVRAAVDAVGRASADFDLTATVMTRMVDGRVAVRATRGVLRSTSGARVVASGGEGIIVAGDIHGSTRLATSGGGLPSGVVTLTRRTAFTPITGTARFAPYTAGSARLALGAVSFSATPRGNTRFRTSVDLSGPLADGRVERLAFPVDGLWDGHRRLAINPDCTPLSVQRLAVAGLALQPARLTLCPTGHALVTLADGRLGGGVRLAATRLQGRLGGTPLTVAATGAEIALGNRGFTVRGLATRLGNPERVTRLDFATVAGRIDAAGLAGTFAGGAGQIANVPLLLANAAGGWSLRGGALALTGNLGVGDAQTATPRFRSMAARDVAVRLAGGKLVATGVLAEPTTGTKVADLRIEHLLASGTGAADLEVPGLVFAKGFQPDLLTPLTFGVIADVKGDVSGRGRIDWSPRGVTSTGTFRTPGIDLAAAFGPVTGIVGEIAFTDLLALRSAPGQVATVKAINPGIVVGDGRIVFQTLPNAQVRVEQGRWPFAGGTLTLEPTLLDFSAARERRMTFRVDGAAADQFLQQFDFKNLNATGVFDGEMPMVFDATGGRIENGRLVVRQGGGGLAYVGDLSEKDLGFWSNLAFGALKSLRYRNLSVIMNGPLAGEMVTEVKFAGISQGAGAKSNFLIRRLQRLPFVFNIRIKAPFRGLLDSAQSFYDPSRLIQRNLPTLIDQQKRDATTPAAPVQPPASGIVP